MYEHITSWCFFNNLFLKARLSPRLPFFGGNNFMTPDTRPLKLFGKSTKLWRKSLHSDGIFSKKKSKQHLRFGIYWTLRNIPKTHAQEVFRCLGFVCSRDVCIFILAFHLFMPDEVPIDRLIVGCSCATCQIRKSNTLPSNSLKTHWRLYR